MWQNDRAADAPTRLENLKELVETISGFESLRAFLEHVALVMDTDNNPDLDAVSIMTLHSAKGLEFRDRVPARLGGRPVPAPARARRGRAARGWRKSGGSPMSGSPAPSSTATSGSSPTVASTGCGSRRCPRASSTNCPRPMSRWPTWTQASAATAGRAASAVQSGHSGGPYGASRFDKAEPFAGNYNTPGWKRAQANKTDAARDNWGTPLGPRRRTHRLRRKRPARLHHRGRTRRPLPPARNPPIVSATASFTSNSATATLPRSTATS